MVSMLRNVLAVVAGIIVGSVINMMLIGLGPSLIPPPPGVDVNSSESLARTMHLFQPRHFVMPFLAHALGTFAGALVAFLLAVRHNARLALVVGAFFLVGGVAAATMIPAPAWFIAVDLVVAYLPMAWLAVRIGSRVKGSEAPR